MTEGSLTGRYLMSTYLSSPGRDALITPRHDQCVALWELADDEVKLIRYWELERLSGWKHHARPIYAPDEAHALLRDLAASEGVDMGDVRQLWGTPGLATTDVVEASFGRSGFPIHSLSHLFAALLSDIPLFRSETIVALAVDGGPDLALETCTPTVGYAAAVSRAGDVRFLAIESPGQIYSAGRVRFGLEPGSLMALAEATTTRVPADVDALLGDVRFTGEPGAGVRAHALVARIHELVERGLTAPQQELDPRFTREEHVVSAVMKIVQACCEAISIRSVATLLDTFGVDPTCAYLALSGGYALNCPTNSRLMAHFGFRGLLAPPCANDGGQALGLGLLGLYAAGEVPKRSFRLGTAFHGRTDLRVDDALRMWSDHVVSVGALDDDQLVADLEQDVVAWIDGAAEIGPRALGHRSLLADPRSPAMKDRLNTIKHRQWWRPVAPIVLEEHARAWFHEARRSPFMLEVFPVREERRASIPVVTHLDGSARVQTLARADDPRLHDAITAFLRSTGVPILGNTSLNDRGEPIVDDAVQALNFCVRKGVRVAYLAGVRVELARPDGTAPPPGPAPRDARFDGQRSDDDAMLAAWERDGIDAELLYLLILSPELRPLANRPGGARRLRRAAAIAKARDPRLAAHLARAAVAGGHVTVSVGRDGWPIEE